MRASRVGGLLGISIVHLHVKTGGLVGFVRGSEIHLHEKYLHKGLLKILVQMEPSIH